MRMGLTLLLVGIVMIGGYAAYALIRFIVVTDDVPILIRVGLPTIVIGVLVLLIKVVWDALRERMRPGRRSYEEAQP